MNNWDAHVENIPDAVPAKPHAEAYDPDTVL